MINFHKNWVHYLTRPFGLFGASLWEVWYNSPYTKELLGVVMPDCLVLEEHPGVMRRYAVKKQLEQFTGAIKKIAINDPQRCKEILENGLNLNAEAEHILKNKNLNLEEAINFMIKLTLCATIFPYFCYTFLNETKSKDVHLLQISEKLRGTSYYPRIINEVIVPLAKKRVGKEAEFMTLAEVFAKDTSQAKLRRKASQSGRRLIYQRIKGEESVEIVDNVFPIIQKLEKTKLRKEVQGRVAYPGKVRGIARLVLSNYPNVHFHKGEIIIAVSTSPVLMPILSLCSAIVTDEGGLTSHAAIICRELKKPCIIGTKFATHIFKDGDMIEVDAIKGIVRILKSRQ